MKTFFFFFWRTPNFWQKKRQNFRFWPKNVTKFRWRPFFFFFFFLETICFWAEITNVFPRFPRNSVAICATFDGSVSSPPIIFTDIRYWARSIAVEALEEKRRLCFGFELQLAQFNEFCNAQSAYLLSSSTRVPTITKSNKAKPSQVVTIGRSRIIAQNNIDNSEEN